MLNHICTPCPLGGVATGEKQARSNLWSRASTQLAVREGAPAGRTSSSICVVRTLIWLEPLIPTGSGITRMTLSIWRAILKQQCDLWRDVYSHERPWRRMTRFATCTQTTHLHVLGLHFRTFHGGDAGLGIDWVSRSAPVSPNVCPRQTSTSTVRGWEHTSDHVPVWIELGGKPKITRRKEMSDAPRKRTAPETGGFGCHVSRCGREAGRCLRRTR